tara:strand:+ start:4167 stop:4424 length:258 start_codon:yes stop_codon:yes gene_type:complete
VLVSAAPSGQHTSAKGNDIYGLTFFEGECQLLPSVALSSHRQPALVTATTCALPESGAGMHLIETSEGIKRVAGDVEQHRTAAVL